MPRQPARHEHRFGNGAGTVVDRGVAYVHAGQHADEALELEDRLERALPELGLVRRIGGQKLLSLDQRVDVGGHEVRVAAGTEEAQHTAIRRVGRCELLEMIDELDLRHRSFERQAPRKSRRRRDCCEQLLDIGHTNRCQHGLPIGMSER